MKTQAYTGTADLKSLSLAESTTFIIFRVPKNASRQIIKRRIGRKDSEFPTCSVRPVRCSVAIVLDNQIAGTDSFLG